MLENQFRRFVLGEVKRLIFTALVSVHILYGDNITAASKCHSSWFDDTSLSGYMQRVICSDLSRYLSYSPYLDILFDMSEQGVPA